MPHRKSIHAHLKKRCFIPLRYRFIILITGLLILILSTLAVILGAHYRRTISKQMEGRGLAIAQSLAAASTANLLTYNYVALERSANQAAQSFDILYVIYHDKEGRVAGYSGRTDLQNKSLDDHISQNALLSNTSLIQKYYNTTAETDSLDIAIPVFPPGVNTRWGMVRVGLSLASIHKQIRQMELVILTVGLIALLFGILISIWAARRITRPLGNLVVGTQEAARGNLDQKIDIQTGDEVQVLAANFTVMTRKILAHRRQLEKRLEQIQHMQRYTSQLLTTMGDGLISVDLSGRIITLNPAACRMLEGSSNSIVQSDHIDALLPDLIDLHGYIRKMINDPRDRRSQEIRFIATEENKAFVAGASVLNDHQGQPLEIILTLHDITALEKWRPPCDKPKLSINIKYCNWREKIYKPDSKY